MKNLISQNSITIQEKPVRIFECYQCGAIFNSDEYSTSSLKETTKERTYNENVNIVKTKNIVKHEDICYTCKQSCIIYETVE